MFFFLQPDFVNLIVKYTVHHYVGKVIPKRKWMNMENIYYNYYFRFYQIETNDPSEIQIFHLHSFLIAIYTEYGKYFN